VGDTFKGQEYLGLYPYVDLTGVNLTGRPSIYVNRGSETLGYTSWLIGSDKLRQAA
jgi:hypothetical protein